MKNFIEVIICGMKIAIINQFTKIDFKEIASWNEEKLNKYETVLLKNSKNAINN